MQLERKQFLEQTTKQEGNARYAIREERSNNKAQLGMQLVSKQIHCVYSVAS